MKRWHYLHPVQRKVVINHLKDSSTHHELWPHRWRALTRMQRNHTYLYVIHKEIVHYLRHQSDVEFIRQINNIFQIWNWSLTAISISVGIPRSFTSISNITASVSISILDALNIRTCFRTYSKTIWHGMSKYWKKIILIKCFLAKWCGAWHFNSRSFST